MLYECVHTSFSPILTKFLCGNAVVPTWATLNPTGEVSFQPAVGLLGVREHLSG